MLAVAMRCTASEEVFICIWLSLVGGKQEEVVALGIGRGYLLPSFSV